MQIVGEMDLQDAAGGVLDGQLDTGLAAEDGRVDEGAGDAQRVRRRQGGQVEEDEQEDESVPNEHEGEPVEAEESRDGAEQSGEKQKDGARGERRVAENSQAAGRARVGRRGRGDESLDHLFGQRRGGEHVGEDAIGIEALELGFRFEDEAMAKAG